MRDTKRYTLLAIVILLISSTVSLTNADTSTTKIKRWTLMVYEDADWPDPFDPINLILVEMRSTDNLDIVVLNDNLSGGGKIWYITKDHKKTLLADWGEVNMGNYTTLRDFIIYCKSNFPSKGYLLVIQGHGGGWLGACWDYTNNRDHLSMYEIKKALVESGGVDILGFTSCFMGAIESVYELRNVTKVYIGSEEETMSGPWPLSEIVRILDKSNDKSVYDVAKSIIRAFSMNNKPIVKHIYRFKHLILFCKAIHSLPRPFLLPTMSAVRTDKISDLVKSIDNLSVYLISNFDQLEPWIRLARIKSMSFPKYSEEKHRVRVIPLGDFVDIYSFLKQMNRLYIRITHPKLAKLIQDAEEKFREAMISNYHDIRYSRAHGLTIFFPLSNEYDILEDYGKAKLDFVDDTHWYDFLAIYLGEAGRGEQP